MRALFLGMIMALASAGAHASEASTAIYDRNPEHLWNRLYRALATRVEGGIEYGVDNSEPYYDAIDDPAKLNAILDEFLRTDVQADSPGSLPRALLLNDVWTAFDVMARGEDRSLQRKLARAIGQLRMPAAAIASLPDNYADAVRAGKFGKDFDAEQPDSAFLPPDLFEKDGPWVEVGGGGGRGLTAPMHVANVSGRSAFRVFIRCPGGRKATLSYLQTLNLFRSPWELKPAQLATRYPTHETVRWDPLQLNPDTPQFPEGTIVALVRQMIVINDRLKPELTPITQAVQFRVYKKIDSPAEQTPANFGKWQSLYELVMRRRDVMAGRDGGFHAMRPDEREYTLASVPMGISRKEQLMGPVVLSTCARCHSPVGIFSVNSYTRLLTLDRTSNPQLLPVEHVDFQRSMTVEWKKEQFNWGLLQGLLAAGS
jgi:hypothetical protein